MLNELKASLPTIVQVSTCQIKIIFIAISEPKLRAVQWLVTHRIAMTILTLIFLREVDGIFPL
jgi:hypothetical protein